MTSLTSAYVELRDARRRILERFDNFGIEKGEFWEAERVKKLVENVQNERYYEIDSYLEDTLRNYIRICYDNIAEVLIALTEKEERKKQIGLNFIHGSSAGRRAEMKRKPDGKMMIEFYKQVVEEIGPESEDNIILKRLQSANSLIDKFW